MTNRILSVIGGLWICGSACADTQPSVLVIGDSNTEIGFVAGALQKNFNDSFGYTGSGYFPMFTGWSGKIPYSGHVPTFDVTHAPSLSEIDMFFDNSRRPAPPHLAPNGLWLTGNTAGAHVTFPFVGGSVDFYWLADATGGTFSLQVDGIVVAASVSTSGTREVKKTSVTGLGGGAHVLTATIISGKVTFLGADVMPNTTGNNQRAVVHNWGNSWCTTYDFAGVDLDVFRTGLQQLNPKVVVILLGTNDGNLDGRTTKDFENNLGQITARVKTALPNAYILIASCHNGADSYITAGSYVRIADKNQVDYWNLRNWFSPFSNSTNTQDNGLHFNANGGTLVATQLWSEIQNRIDGSRITPETNLIINPGFECYGPDGWTGVVTHTMQSGANARGGSYAITVNTGNDISQTVTGLKPNTTYTYTGWLKSGSGGQCSIYAKNHGGSEVTVSTTNTTYNQVSLEFTTGPNNTSALIGFRKTSSSMTVDDLSLVEKTGKSATPTFSPAAAPFFQPTLVTMESTTEGATIHYTTDGSMPSATVGTIYTGPVNILANTTLKAIAFKSGLLDSVVISGAYEFRCGPPAFSPAGGVFTGAQSVMLSTVTDGATIRYTTDGSQPTSTNGTTYTGPISVSGNRVTLKAIAFRNGLPDSDVTSGDYSTVGYPTSIPVVLLGSDVADTNVAATLNYTAPKLATNPNGNLWPDGRPSYLANDLILTYDNPFSSQVIAQSKYIQGPYTNSNLAGMLWNGTQLSGLLAGNHDISPVISGSVRLLPNVSGTAKVSVVLHSGGSNLKYLLKSINYNQGAATVTLNKTMTVATAGTASIYQLQIPLFKDIPIDIVFADATPPGGAWFGVFLALDSVLADLSPLAPTGLNAIGISSSQIDLIWMDNAANETGFRIERKTGAGGTWAQISTTNANETGYTDAGLNPSTKYYYRVMAFNTSGESLYSNEANVTTQEASASPTFNPVAGTYNSAQSVEISSATNGATIRYTTDGSTPSQSAGAIYSGPINIGANTSLKAIAYKTGLSDSMVTSGDYLIVLPESPFDLWRKSKFSTAQLGLEAISGPYGDPDFDGLNNLLEYGFDRDPLAAENIPPTIANLDANGNMTITFKRARPASDLIYRVFGSADLMTWSQIGPDNPGIVGTEVTVTDSPPADSTRHFLRIKVETPPDNP